MKFHEEIQRQPWFAVEVKISPQPPSRTLLYYASRLQIPFLYQIHLESQEEFLKMGFG